MAARHVTIQTQAGGANVTLPAATMRGPQPVFKPEDVSDAPRLARLLNQLARWIIETLGPAASNPVNQAVILKNVSLSNGVTTNILHGLGRNPVGWICVGARTSAFNAYEATLESGLDRSRVIAMRSSATGTYDLMVF